MERQIGTLESELWKPSTLFYAWRTWSDWVKWHVQDNMSLVADLATQLWFLSASPLLVLLYHTHSHLNPLMKFWGEGVHQNSTWPFLQLGLDRVRDLSLLGTWNCYSKNSWYLSLFLFLSVFCCFVKKFFRRKSGMNFPVILTKSYANLYVPVLACSQLKQVMYGVNVSDMFRNIIMKIQTGCFWLPWLFLLEENIFKWETVPPSSEKEEF